ncbi:MAG: PQQ-dependent sugar dehydrogenase [Bryobacterales bacterium]
MSRQKRAAWLGFLIVAVAATAISQSGDLPVNWKELPKPFHSESARNQPEVVSRPAGAELKLPAGFAIEEYMTGFERPRFMLQGPNNEILLSDSGGREGATGLVYVLNGKTKTKIIEGLDRPYGLALKDDWLYVAEPASVKRYKYDAKTMKVNGSGTEIISLKGFDRGHWTRSLLFNADKTKLYVTVGSGSNIDMGEDPMRAALHRYNPDGTGHETVATGLRNVIGLRWNPGTEDIWASIQERDGLGDDLVSDYLVKIREGGFYGWPIAYTGPHKEPRHENVDMAKVKSTLYPDVLLGAHVAVLDILFYTGNQFPEKYRGGMFLAFHGSWNRAERTGYSITYIPFKDGKPQSGPQDFMTGWMLDPGKREVWGRPVGLLQMSDGSLLVTDDGGAKIWRISHKG